MHSKADIVSLIYYTVPQTKK